MKTALLVFVSILGFQTAAQANYDDVVKNCFEKNWQQTQCQIQQPTDEMYAKLGTIDSVSGDIISAYDAAYDRAAKMFRHARGAGGTMSGGDYTLYVIAHKIKELRVKQSLSQCITSCVIQCTTSNLLKYDSSFEGMNNKFVPVSQVVENGSGVCTEFSRVGQKLYSKLGFKSSVQLSLNTQHAFVKVSINNSDYFIEPQSRDCIHFNPTYSDEAVDRLNWVGDQVDKLRKKFN